MPDDAPPADGGLDALLDDALADFDAPLRPPAAAAPARATAPSTSSRPFDPLGRGRGRGARPAAGSRSTFNYAAAATGGGAAASRAAGGAGPRLPPRGRAAAPPPAPDATLAALADQLAAAVSGAGGDGADDTDPDALVARLEATLASLSAASAAAAAADDDDDDDTDAGNPALQGLASGLLRAMLAKDVMAAPMTEIRDRYPPWLAANRATLPPADLERYTKQAGIVARVVAHYESENPDFDALFNLLQEMQACGAPPQDIVDELAPGLAFGEDGMPSLGGGGDACCVM